MKKFFRSKKGQALTAIAGLAIALVSVAIVLVVGFLVMSTTLSQIGTVENIDATNSSQCITSAACNGTSATITAMNNIPTFLPVIVIVAIGGILIGLVSLIRGRR